MDGRPDTADPEREKSSAWAKALALLFPMGERLKGAVEETALGKEFLHRGKSQPLEEF
jgi:hypothetical protein